MPGNPSQRTHTRPTLWGLKKRQYVCSCVCVHVLPWVHGKACASLYEHACVCVCVELLSVLSVLFCVCGCVRRQISKNARWEVGPYFQAVDGKQPLGSTGLKQLEKFVEGARRGCTAPRLQLSAGKGKP